VTALPIDANRPAPENGPSVRTHRDRVVVVRQRVDARWLDTHRDRVADQREAPGLARVGVGVAERWRPVARQTRRHDREARLRVALRQALGMCMRGGEVTTRQTWRQALGILLHGGEVLTRQTRRRALGTRM
jgi:hypothetical protein